ncbi:hypothetical protein MBOT_00420 [Mycobacterium botniense]|uniref:Phospholipid/glycerol acyltransferase domain-containing protein n=1 Tax=Mycobacterium botniense TaxID=84962 RepID=A0A7I9XTR9_9MYCO|nr:hypothetical protein MBOT_00420 [Mycobacterium botniense]
MEMNRAMTLVHNHDHTATVQLRQLGSSSERGKTVMAEPFFRMMEIIVPPIVAANGITITYEGLENIPDRGGVVALNHTSYVDWLPLRSPPTGDGGVEIHDQSGNAGGVGSQLRDPACQTHSG